MRLFRPLLFLALPAIVGCVHPVSPVDVVPDPAALAAIDVVLPHASGFSISDPKQINGIVSFLREECRWSVLAAAERSKSTAEPSAYRLVLRQPSGATATFVIQNSTVSTSGYSCRLSSRSLEKLDALCGVASVHLSTFDPKRDPPAHGKASDVPLEHQTKA